MQNANENSKFCLIGNGGCARELACQFFLFNKDINIVGYVNKIVGDDIIIGDKVIKYLGDDLYLYQHELKPLLTIGDVNIRREFINNIKNKELFINAFVSNAIVSSDIKIGIGNIVSSNCFVSTNVKLGDFNFINIGTTICHDCLIRNNVVISPNVNIAGNVIIGDDTFIGIGATVKQGIHIGSNVIIGAGAVVIDDIKDGETVVGVPAKPLNR